MSDAPLTINDRVVVRVGTTRINAVVERASPDGRYLSLAFPGVRLQMPELGGALYIGSMPMYLDADGQWRESLGATAVLLTRRAD